MVARGTTGCCRRTSSESASTIVDTIVHEGAQHLRATARTSACRGDVRLVVTLLVLGSCGAPGPARPATPPGIVRFADTPREDRPTWLEPLPAGLELLDLDPDAVDWRWPLPRPPQLVPSAELSSMFETREPWSSLCTARRDPRGVDRDEALAYLRAWCDGPPDLALAKALGPLTSVRTMSIAGAAAFDLAAILESELGAGAALDWLRAHGVRDAATLDALAAAYLSADRREDARVVIEALRGHRAYGTLACRRWFRELFVADRGRRDQLRLALAGASSDAVCGRLSAHANCTLSWGLQASGTGALAAQLDLERCTPILLDRPELTAHAYLTIAAAHWPRSRSFEDWFTFAVFASGALGAPRADELIGAAFENAVLVSDCEAQLDQLRAAAERLPIERLRTIASLSRPECQLRRGKPDR